MESEIKDGKEFGVKTVGDEIKLRKCKARRELMS